MSCQHVHRYLIEQYEKIDKRIFDEKTKNMMPVDFKV